MPDINTVAPDVLAKVLGLSLPVLCQYMALKEWPLRGTLEEKRHFVKHKQKRQPKNKISLMPMKFRQVVIHSLLDGKSARLARIDLAEAGYTEKLSDNSFSAYRRTDEYKSTLARRIDIESQMIVDTAVADLISDPRQAMAMNGILIYKLQQRLEKANPDEARDVCRRLAALVLVRRIYLSESEAANMHKYEDLKRELEEYLNSTNTLDGKEIIKRMDDVLGVIRKKNVKNTTSNDNPAEEDGGLVDTFPVTPILAVSTGLDS